jgi:hypothetical protein
VLVAASRRFDDAGRVIEYAELIARADTRVEYRYRVPAAVLVAPGVRLETPDATLASLSQIPGNTCDVTNVESVVP